MEIRRWRRNRANHCRSRLNTRAIFRSVSIRPFFQETSHNSVFFGVKQNSQMIWSNVFCYGSLLYPLLPHFVGFNKKSNKMATYRCSSKLFFHKRFSSNRFQIIIHSRYILKNKRLVFYSLPCTRKNFFRRYRVFPEAQNVKGLRTQLFNIHCLLIAQCKKQNDINALWHWKTIMYNIYILYIIVVYVVFRGIWDTWSVIRFHFRWITALLLWIKYFRLCGVLAS